jgi:hypothetical protein
VIAHRHQGAADTQKPRCRHSRRSGAESVRSSSAGPRLS